MTDARGYSLYMQARQAVPVAGGNGNAAHRHRARAGRTWPWALAVAAGLGLMLALALVVQDVVRQAATRHADTAAQSAALWRCNTVPGREAREVCRRVAGAVTAASTR